MAKFDSGYDFGGLVLGEQFIWVDLLRYVAGAMLCGAIEIVFGKRPLQRPR